MDDDLDLQRRADELDETPAADHALTLALAGLNAIPAIGGVIATFVSEYVPRRKQARLVAFVQDLSRAFTAERDRIDREFARTDEFEGLAEDVLDRVQQRKNEGKFRYWADLLAGMATTKRPPAGDRDRLIETLDGIRLSNLRLLFVIATTRAGPPANLIGSVGQTVEWRMPGVPAAEYRRDWDELNALGLVDRFPSAMMTPSGAGNLAGRLTDYGRQFIRLISLEGQPPDDVAAR